MPWPVITRKQPSDARHITSHQFQFSPMPRRVPAQILCARWVGGLSSWTIQGSMVPLDICLLLGHCAIQIELFPVEETDLRNRVTLLIPSTQSTGRPTQVFTMIWIRELALAALAGESLSFLDLQHNYRTLACSASQLLTPESRLRQVHVHGTRPTKLPRNGRCPYQVRPGKCQLPFSTPSYSTSGWPVIPGDVMAEPTHECHNRSADFRA